MHAKIIVIMSVKELVYLMQNPVDLHKISVHFSHQGNDWKIANHQFCDAGRCWSRLDSVRPTLMDQ
jgi:hypothetical protein